MAQNWLLLILVASTLFGFQQVFGVEISATPLKDPFGPNDWIEIDLKIDGYQGGPVIWELTRPDGSMNIGELESFKAAKKLHVIQRDAFDRQFGNWTLTYNYNGINKTLSVDVEPLVVEIHTDRESYYPGDT
ncbi:MAG TPA: hypothetical protein VFG25_03950, partial [Nitrosopumilaceae archaeon]|nr:hypothetical protein [Nitrosopumilaceae archaeon]